MLKGFWYIYVGSTGSLIVKENARERFQRVSKVPENLEMEQGLKLYSGLKEMEENLPHFGNME